MFVCKCWYGSVLYSMDNFVVVSTFYCTWVLHSPLELRITEVMVTSGSARRAKLQSNRHLQQTSTQLFTGRMPFLSPNQQCRMKRYFHLFVGFNLFAANVFILYLSVLWIVGAKKPLMNFVTRMNLINAQDADSRLEAHIGLLIFLNSHVPTPRSNAAISLQSPQPPPIPVYVVRTVSSLESQTQQFVERFPKTVLVHPACL